jgi:anthranilate synthase component II
MTIVLIDNYDSFVHNLARYFERLGQSTHVVRHDAIDADGVRALRPTVVVLSPGPRTPREAGCSLNVVRDLHAEVPILGICLGHQAIAEAFGGQIVRAAEPVHGRASHMRHDARGIFEGLRNPLLVGRYHSLVVDPASFPRALEVTARTEDGAIMALAHRELPVVGLQFHPESILTDCGYDLLVAFLEMCGLGVPSAPPSIDDERHEPVSRELALPRAPVTF